ncbi:MAG TPA: hypothetical protein PK313_06720, partial [Myxococcota bacterium]|nr:hypothetical protein [Myxococcota bacterium]
MSTRFRLVLAALSISLAFSLACGGGGDDKPDWGPTDEGQDVPEDVRDVPLVDPGIDPGPRPDVQDIPDPGTPDEGQDPGVDPGVDPGIDVGRCEFDSECPANPVNG